MHELLTKTFYQTFQQGKSAFALAHKMVGNQARQFFMPSSLDPNNTPLSPEILQYLMTSRTKLLDADWQDAEKGIYPQELLFDNSWEDFFIYYPAVWLDYAQTWPRIAEKKYQDFSPDSEINNADYPRYYLQNFHYQTNGYLSDLSASLYDLQVELLFNGAADAMRRRVLAPLKRVINGRSPAAERAKILDVACGTGRTLKFIRASLPTANLFGIDLSPPYLRKAGRLLAEELGELPQLVQGQAENMPYKDDYFDGITCVFLFHELPGPVRQKVIAECFRVLQPGGVLVICDSIQIADAPNLEAMLKSFPDNFHEPFYNDYIKDDLIERLENTGFTNIEKQVHFVSKYLVAHKPDQVDTVN
ncbi:MAG: class I SAM-dependent methyltransferase [Microcoleaceae cyanobacterium]